MENQTTTQPQGKKLAVAGFVISLIALIGYFIVAIAVAASAMMGGGYGLGIFWLLLSLAGTGLCVMGMMKLGKTGGKKGLAIAGMVCGIIAVILTLMLVMGIGKMQAAGGEFGDAFKKGMTEGLENLDTAKLRMDMEAAMQGMTDSLSAH